MNTELLGAEGSYQQDKIILIGHRGVRSRGYQNSRAAFEAIVDNPPLDFAGVELDIHSTADGEIVVHHDATLSTGAAIGRLSLAELRTHRLPDGSPVPTLVEVMQWLPATRMFIEVKGIDARWDAKLIDIIRHDPVPSRCQIHGFDHRVVARLGRAAPELVTGVLSASYPIDPIGAVLAAGARVLWQQWELIDAALVAACRAQAIDLVAWTAPNLDCARQLGRLGVSQVCLEG